MRWSIIRLIWFRELRDQLRDRRTVFMIVVLPILLYPILGVGVLQFALGFLKQESTVGIYGSANLPPAESTNIHPITAAACTAFTPIAPASSAITLAAATEVVRGQGYPPLLVPSDGKQRFHASYFDQPDDAETLQVKILQDSTPEEGAAPPEPAIDRSPLEAKQVDLLIVIPPDFQEQLREGRPIIYVLPREGDDRSRLVALRTAGVLNRWKKR